MTTLRFKNELLIFLAGVSLMLVNFIMVHHVTIAFRQMEIAVMIFTLAYFTGISLGYYVSDKLSKTTLQRLMPLYLLIQMLVVVFVQAGSYFITKKVSQVSSWGTGKIASYIIVFLVVMAGVTSLYSIFLPMVIETGHRNVKRYYSIEIIGSLVGLALLPLIASVSHELLLAVYFLAFLGIASLINTTPLIMTGMTVVISLFLFYFSYLDKMTSVWFYQKWYDRSHVKEVIYSRYTPYHKIEVLGLHKNRRMLVLNGKRQFSHGGHFNYSYYVAEFPARLLGGPKVCLLGAGSMSTIGRLGDYSPSIKIVELDRGVFETSKEYFQFYNRLDELKNWVFVSDDAKHFLGNTKERFDLILDDIPPARSRQIALTYTEEFFKLVKNGLTGHGIFSMPSLIPLNKKSQYGKKLIATMAHVFDKYFVIQVGGTAYFYGGGPGMKDYDKETIRLAIHHKNKGKAKIFLKDEIDQMVQGAPIITINNMADLIYD